MSFLNGLYESSDIQLNGENSGDSNTTGGAEFYLISSLGENFVIYVDGTAVFVLNSSTGVLTISCATNFTNSISVGGVLTEPVYLRGSSSNNLGCGSSSLTNVTGGGLNVAYGINTLSSNTTGSSNVAIGTAALNLNSIGGGNVGVGYNAGNAITTTYWNTCLGYNAGSNAYGGFGGTNCTLVGAESYIASAGLNNSSCFGRASYINASNQISFGSGTETIIFRGNVDLIAGGGTAIATTQSPNDKTTKVATTAFVSRMIYYNQTSLNMAFNQEQFNSITTGTNNTLIGYKAGYLMTSGGGNTAIGVEALRSCLTGTNNFVLGQASLYTLTSGSWNVAIGVLCLANSNGSYNVGIGSYCGGVSLGDFNIYIGWFTAINATTDGTNIGIGSYVYPNLTTGKDNVAIGVSAGGGITTGSNNTFIGQASSASVGNLAFATAIGSGSQATTSNSVYLGRSTDMTYATGGLTIPTTKTLTYNGSTLSGSIVDTGTANQSITAVKSFDGFDNTIPNYCGSSFVCPVFRPPLFTLFQSINNSCHAFGSNTARNLLADGTNTGCYILGQDNLYLKTQNTNNVQSIGGSNMTAFTNENFAAVTVVGQGNLINSNENSYSMSNVVIVGGGHTFKNTIPFPAITPTSVSNACFIAAYGIQLTASSAITNVFGIRTAQPITKSNQGIIGDSTEITLHSTGQKVIVTGGLELQNQLQLSIASPTINWNSANYTITAPFKNVYHYILNANTTVTLPNVSATTVGQMFYLKKRGGLSTAVLSVTTTGAQQPFFSIGGNLGTITMPVGLISASQSSAQLMAVQSHFAGSGTGSVSAGLPTLTVSTWGTLPNAMITIGTSITIAGVTKRVSAFGSGVGGTGTYQMDSNYAVGTGVVAITSTNQFGYDILFVQ